MKTKPRKPILITEKINQPTESKIEERMEGDDRCLLDILAELIAHDRLEKQEP